MLGRGVLLPHRFPLYHRLVYPEQRSDKARDAHPPLPVPFAGIVCAEVLATMAAYLEAVRCDGADYAPCHGVTRAIPCSAQYAANRAARSLSTFIVTTAHSQAARSLLASRRDAGGAARRPA